MKWLFEQYGFTHDGSRPDIMPSVRSTTSSSCGSITRESIVRGLDPKLNDSSWRGVWVGEEG